MKQTVLVLFVTVIRGLEVLLTTKSAQSILYLSNFNCFSSNQESIKIRIKGCYGASIYYLTSSELIEPYYYVKLGSNINRQKIDFFAYEGESTDGFKFTATGRSNMNCTEYRLMWSSFTHKKIAFGRRGVINEQEILNFDAVGPIDEIAIGGQGSEVNWIVNTIPLPAGRFFGLTHASTTSGNSLYSLETRSIIECAVLCDRSVLCSVYMYSTDRHMCDMLYFSRGVALEVSFYAPSVPIYLFMK